MDHLVQSIRSMNEFFTRSTNCFEEKDSAFTPKPEIFTVAQHVAHTAQVVDWFIDGAFSPAGLKEDFAAADAEVRKVTSLAAAREWMKKSCARAESVIASKSPAQLQEKIGGNIMAGLPRAAIIEAMADHTAHHRGALTVYARLLNKVPAMPYM